MPLTCGCADGGRLPDSINTSIASARRLTFRGSGWRSCGTERLLSHAGMVPGRSGNREALMRHAVRHRFEHKGVHGDGHRDACRGREAGVGRPVNRYLPWFELSDPYVTREITVRDFLVHRSGLGLGAGDLPGVSRVDV